MEREGREEGGKGGEERGRAGREGRREGGRAYLQGEVDVRLDLLS